MRWKIKLWGVDWDDGKGEYDVSGLPRNVECIVIADDEAEAVDQAMQDAGESCGSLINGVAKAEVELLKDRRRIVAHRDDLD